MFKYENLHRVHESVGNPDSKGANLSWMPYKDLKILTKCTPYTHWAATILQLHVHLNVFFVFIKCLFLYAEESLGINYPTIFQHVKYLYSIADFVFIQMHISRILQS